MLNKLKNFKLQKSARGFTIIEVMIVLAIAGLILLIVFLAVPALQRSSRNTQRKNDVSSLGSGVSNYISNNNGSVPDTIKLTAGTATISCTIGNVNGTSCDTTDKNQETAKVGIFTTITVDASVTGSDTAPDTSTILYVPGYTCNNSNTGLGSANSRSAAMLYQVENGGSNANECVEQ